MVYAKFPFYLKLFGARSWSIPPTSTKMRGMHRLWQLAQRKVSEDRAIEAALIDFGSVASSLSTLSVESAHGAFFVGQTPVVLDGNTSFVSVLTTSDIGGAYRVGRFSGGLQFVVTEHFLNTSPERARAILMDALSEAVVSTEVMPLPVRTSASLRVDEEAHVEAAALTMPLMDGWLFDGARYVHHDGRRAFCRPDIKDKLERWIDAENKKIAHWNQKWDT
jgi:hypothetical protein